MSHDQLEAPIPRRIARLPHGYHTDSRDQSTQSSWFNFPPSSTFAFTFTAGPSRDYGASTPQAQHAGSAIPQLFNFAAEDVRALLIGDLKKMLTANFKRLLHFMLCKVKAINLDGDDVDTLTDAKIETDLDACVEQMNAKLYQTVEVQTGKIQPSKRTSKAKKAPQRKTQPQTPKLEMESVLNDLDKYCRAPTEATRYPRFVGAVNGALELLQSLNIGSSGPSPEKNAPNYLVSLVNDPKIKTSIHKGNKWGRKTDIDFAFLRSIRQIPGDKYRTSSHAQLMTALRTIDKTDTKAIPWMETLACCEMKKTGKNINSCVQAVLKYKRGAPQQKLSDLAPMSSAEIEASFKEEVRENKARKSRTDAEKNSEIEEDIVSKSSNKRSADDEANGHAAKKSKGLDGNPTVKSETVEKKEKHPAKRLEKLKTLPAQIAEYAAEAMYNCFGRDHVMNFAITDDILHVWYFDHQGPIQTTGINFIKDLPYFLLLLYALQRFSLEDWGYIPELRLLETKQYVSLVSENPEMSNAADPDDIRKPLEKTPVVSDLRRAPPRAASRKYRPDTAVSEPPPPQLLPVPPPPPKGHHFRTSEEKRSADYNVHALSGRSTWVVHGEIYDDDVKVVDAVVKVSYREQNRQREAEFVQYAKNECIKHNFESYCDYLPDILFEHEFRRFSTAFIRDHLDARKEDREAYDTLAIRVPYMIVMPEYEPITTKTKNWSEFMNAFVALFFVHALLWSFGLEHGDISERNLMWDPKTQKPKLCDYDLSHLRDDTRPAGFSNTGTWRFMALELLTQEAMQGNVKRLYRHDAESFFAVLLWILCRYRDGKDIQQKRDKNKKTNSELLENWDRVTYQKVRDNRETTHGRVREMSIPQGLSPDIWSICVSFYCALEYALAKRHNVTILRAERKLLEAANLQNQLESIEFIDFFLSPHPAIEEAIPIKDTLTRCADFDKLKKQIYSSVPKLPQPTGEGSERTSANATVL